MKKFIFPILGIALFLIFVSLSQNPASKIHEKEWDHSIKLYKTQYCGCCEEYVRYLNENGYRVEEINVDDLSQIFNKYNVPYEMRSCHISELERYFAVGHIPAEAIEELMKNSPEIDGISLPGMPSGSPGMPGDKKEPFIIYALKDGNAKIFMTL